MKITNKIGIAASLIVTAMISSCSDKGYWDEAPLEDAAYSFACSQYSESLAPGAQEVKITLNRSNSSAQASVNITFTPDASCPSDITVSSPVVFAAGSNTADVVINITDAQPPYTYSGTLSFDGEVSYSGNATCEISLPVEYTYTSIGTGKFIDTWVMDNATDYYDVEIMKAEGFERYRVMNPYKEYYETIGPASWEDWIGSTGPEYVEFWELSNGTLMYNAYYSGLNYYADSTTPINIYPYTYFSTGVAGYDKWYSTGFAVLSPFYYIPDYGGWGQQAYSIQIQLP